ncbi:aminopeptidase [Nonomuraea sp. WAC 01424]|uniref:M55 family metallopeptidase n=1 Tax=Nonomuraea sp. WAC 01424 TaxID=2203200 RepID=UPI000F76D7DF|nr:M55 family metallopeptidase [Nonomuraea sp. WAC 01424]RSN15312.1 aminopeptidase [Nonomuraea sp. WAC 01424]
MRVFVSIDMEGVAGVATLDQAVRGGTGYPRAQELMTAEADAAVRGAFDAGADEVVVNDSHGTMDNLLHAGLDPRAQVVTGSPKPLAMMQGVSEGDAVALFVGYHAAAGEQGVLAHSFSGTFRQIRVNGRPVGELEVNALYAASLGVPVGLVTGDDLVCAAASKTLPGVLTVPVKRAVGFHAATSVHPSVATERIRGAARDAVSGHARLECPPVEDTLHVEIDFTTPLACDYAMYVPEARRAGGQGLVREVGNATDLIRLISACLHLSAQATRETAAVAARR